MFNQRTYCIVGVCVAIILAAAIFSRGQSDHENSESARLKSTKPSDKLESHRLSDSSVQFPESVIPTALSLKSEVKSRNRLSAEEIKKSIDPSNRTPAERLAGIRIGLRRGYQKAMSGLNLSAAQEEAAWAFLEARAVASAIANDVVVQKCREYRDEPKGVTSYSFAVQARAEVETNGNQSSIRSRMREHFPW